MRAPYDIPFLGYTVINAVIWGIAIVMGILITLVLFTGHI